ncbi:hypothetical protein [Thalassobaculum salexigens]|uniref:hypothetical protein n=1 Tax=Thalassobaculum salexigens TaxID=455360 RepID=UPI00248DEE4A|nr:hypothetical protein [Thalassobaculum salexigens]
MTDRWRDLEGDGRRTAETIFSALDVARGLTDCRAPSRPSVSAIWSALATGRALPGGIVPDADLDALLADAASVAFPRQAAAATPQDGIDRHADGARLRVVPSLGAPGQSYLAISFDDPTATASRLIAVGDGAEPLVFALPPPVDGTVQILVDNSDPILVALADADARLYLV